MSARKEHTRAIGNGITVLSFGFVCAYIYKGDSKTICIDAGLDANRMRRELADCSLGTRDIDAVFLTHSDRDHAGGLPAFPDTKVFMSVDEAEMIQQKKARFFGLIHNKMPGRKLDYVADGDEIEVGGIRVKCISTPGHTLGSMSFLIDGKYLFVGDALNLKEGGAVMDRRLLQMDRRLQEKSIRTLAKLGDIEMMFTAHTGFTDDFGKAMGKWKDDRSHAHV